MYNEEAEFCTKNQIMLYLVKKGLNRYVDFNYQMKRIKPYSVISAILLITLITTQASYVVEDDILLLRSQYLPDNEQIEINGELEENYWAKAGSIEIEYNNSFLLQIKFVNDNENLYLAISVPDDLKLNDSVGIFFDTDGDGILSQPEDAKIAGYQGTTFKAYDNYWDGDTWTRDRTDPSTDSEYNVGANLANDKLTYEFEIAMVSSNIQYDGFQITNPSGIIIAFAIQVVTSEGLVYDFPTHPTNATGFVDLKLAGPEDQDLPAYIPPEFVTETDYYNDNPEAPVNEVFGLLDAPVSFFPVLLSFVAVVFVLRRRKNA
jgi:hypothetical protein